MRFWKHQVDWRLRKLFKSIPLTYFCCVLPFPISFSNGRLFSIGISGTFPACNSYSSLTTSDRLVSYAASSSKCDSGLGNNWYRFVEKAGTSMPEICPPRRRCSANAPGWLNGKHPTVEEGEVTRTVCFQYGASCCRWSKDVKVFNCSGFYVYKLPNVPLCYLRYCGKSHG